MGDVVITDTTEITKQIKVKRIQRGQIIRRNNQYV